MTEAISGHCPQCKGRRRAFVKAEYVTEWFDDHDRMSGKLRYYILECGGCEDIFFKRELTSDDDDDEDERWSQKDNAYVRFSNVHEMFWPKPQIRSKPDWVTYHHLKDRELVQVLEEVYKALNEQMPVLAAMGNQRHGNGGKANQAIDKVAGISCMHQWLPRLPRLGYTFDPKRGRS